MLAGVLPIACSVHLAMVWGEVTLGHPTAHASLAIEEMTRGHYVWFFRFGLVLTFGGVLAPWLMIPAALAALAGLLLHEHAYVQAGQSVPLA